ncbi:MAG: hypothetical protein QM713_14615 [Arachnia sp.]
MTVWGIVGVLVGLGVLAWCIFVDVRLRAEERLAARWVSWAARWQDRTGPISLAVSVAALVGYCLLALLGGVIADALGSSLWTLCTALPAMLGYAPFVFITAPSRSGGYSWRGALREAGADDRLQRRIAWWAGPPSLLGLGAVVITLVAVFTAA